MKKQKDRLERYHVTHHANRELKWKILSEYVAHFGRYHLPWLHELAERCKASGELPVWAVVTLPMYYRDIRDREVAAFAGTLLKEDCTYGQIQEMREMLGEHPWEWFEGREFVQLSLGSVQNLKTGGVRNWVISRMYDRLWRECQTANEYGGMTGGISRAISRLTDTGVVTVYGALCHLVGGMVCKPSFSLRLLAHLYVCDFKVVTEDPLDMRCPVADGIRGFIDTWIPDYDAHLGTLDDAISLFGFENHYDFLYAYLGYEELKKKDPKACSVYATAYHRWYVKGVRKNASQWRSIQPELKI